MSEAAENVARLRAAYQRWHDTRGADADGWLALMDDDVAMKSVAGGAPAMPLSKRNRGKVEAEQYLRAIPADWEMLHFTVTEFIAEGDRVVVLADVAYRHRRTGKVVESPKADVLRMKGGRIVEYMEFFDTAAAFAAARPDGA